jgi:alpha-L-fucosidase
MIKSMKISQLVLIYFFAFCFLPAYAQNPILSQAGNDDEQGLEIPKNLVLTQDKEAYVNAIKTWYTADLKKNPNRLDWYSEAKFGCFIHWGVYSSLAGEWNGTGSPGYSEHIMRSRKIPLNEYREKVVIPFDAPDFDADKWVRTAKEAGMKFMIVTVKHHDGFAMYPSNAYPYDIRMTKFKRDPIKEFSDAAKKYGIKFGFYYSHAFDWEYPDAPGNDWDYENPGGDKLLHGANWWENFPGFLPKAEKYVNEKSILQVLELISMYHPDLLWFDTPQKLPLYLNLKILKAIRIADSSIVVNGRLARVGNVNFGDYVNTGDRAAFFRPTPGVWEAIPTTNESYGYNKFDLSHKTPTHFLRLLASAAAKGGNILLNIGPMGSGAWDTKDINILKGIGSWMKLNGASIYGTARNPLPLQSWGEITQKADTLYLHVFDWPKDGKLVVGGLNTKVKMATLLTDTKMKPLTTSRNSDSDLVIRTPKQMPDTISTVIKLVIVGKPENKTLRLLSTTDTNRLLVFDANAPGRSFSYGDGKINREFATNWKSKEQWLEWDFRTNQLSVFDLKLAYNTAENNQSGEMELDVDGKKFPLTYNATEKANMTEELPVGSIQLNKGTHKIKLSLVKFEGMQAMQPLFIKLAAPNSHL